MEARAAVELLEARGDDNELDTEWPQNELARLRGS
jgi:hypothetical protein